MSGNNAGLTDLSGKQTSSEGSESGPGVLFHPQCTDSDISLEERIEAERDRRAREDWNNRFD